DLRLELARGLRHLGQADEAQVHVQTVLLAEPGSVPARALRASLLHQGAEYGAALALYEALLNEDPDNAQADLGASSAPERLGRRGEAQSKLAPLLEKEPQHVEALSLKA